MISNSDISFMKRAMELAIKGAGLVNPNPQVGAVLTKNNTIIGEGYHQQFGGPHAEINAFDHAISDVRDATLYVTMEPCNHYGKTPPCTDRIIKEKIKRVVVGTTDPNIRVFEKGIAQLRAAGIAVDVIEGELQREIMKMNEIYNHFTGTRLPFTALKSAMTLDGKIATYSGYSKWITNEKSRAMVHELRHTYAAIMVGVNTIVTDNPALTDRSNHVVRQHPLRIIVDSSGRTPLDAAVLNTEEAPTLIAVTQKVSPDFMNQMKDRGASVMVCPEKDQKVDLAYLNRELGQMNIDSILLEGGSTLNFSALEAGIVHKIFAFISPKLVGGRKAFTPVGGQGFEKMEQAITLNVDSIHRFDEDIMIEAYLMKIKDVHGNH